MKVIAVVTLMLGASALLLTRNVAEARPTDNVVSNTVIATVDPDVANVAINLVNSKILADILAGNQYGCCQACCREKSSKSGGLVQVDIKGVLDALPSLLGGSSGINLQQISEILSEILKPALNLMDETSVKIPLGKSNSCKDGKKC